jgi:hypothetical protein
METKHLSKTFHIFYAWAEGPWHGMQLVEAMKRAGFTEAPIDEATVLIAHSAGSYLVRPLENNKIVLVIDPPYWPGRSLALRIFRKVWQDLKLRRGTPLYSLKKMFWTDWAILTKPKMTVKAYRATHTKNELEAIPNGALVIRNDDDVFCTPEIAKVIKNKLITLPGLHDDCWHNPKPYVKLLESEYKLL